LGYACAGLAKKLMAAAISALAAIVAASKRVIMVRSLR
jgi:hypothetical protein